MVLTQEQQETLKGIEQSLDNITNSLEGLVLLKKLEIKLQLEQLQHDRINKEKADGFMKELLEI